MKQNVEVVRFRSVPQVVEQIVDAPVPQGVEHLKSTQDQTLQRTVEQVIGEPLLTMRRILQVGHRA